MSDTNSLYSIIKSSLVDGRLPEGFSLPRPEDSQEIPFADGAMDGIYIHHMEHTPMTEDDRAQMVLAVDCMNRADLEASDEALRKLGSMTSAIASVDEFQVYIVSHAKNPNDPPDPADPDAVRLSLKNICDTARWLIAGSMNIESVKFGLIVCEIFKSHPEEIREVIRTLGLSDEFTIFSVWNLRNWENGNEEIFRLIQKVRGWGRVHAMNYLEPRTADIRHWILMNGTDNDVMPSYTSILTWEKAGVNYFLQGTLTPEEFHAVSHIVDALLDEGPCEGISLIGDQKKFLNLYLDQAAIQPLNADDYDTILSISDWASEEHEDLPDIYKRCKEFLNSSSCEKVTGEALSSGKSYRLADALGIEYKETLFDLMKEDFDTYHAQCWRLMEDEEYADRVIELIITGLNSPVINNRFMALKALETWTEIMQKPIKQISKRIHEELYKLPSKEPDQELKGKILDLLRGKIFTSEELDP